MRKYVLPTMGYSLTEGLWVHPSRKSILDEEVEKHHSRLSLEILKLEGKDRAAQLRDRLSGRLGT